MSTPTSPPPTVANIDPVNQTPPNENPQSNNSDSHPKRRIIGMAQFRSTDPVNPDVIEVIPQSMEIYTISFSQCTDVRWKVDGRVDDAMLPLRALNSANPGLINPWTKAQKEGKLQIGKPVKIMTWLGKSKNGNKIRRYGLVT